MQAVLNLVASKRDKDASAIAVSQAEALVAWLVKNPKAKFNYMTLSSSSAHPPSINLEAQLRSVLKSHQTGMQRLSGHDLKTNDREL